MSNVSLLHGEHNLNKEVTLIICIFSTRSKISCAHHRCTKQNIKMLEGNK